MRVLQGRGDWRPGFRIPSLRRYAFIGDSHAYGAGVAPDQTLSAHTERQMNQLLPAWPVEAVNLGASGYNLWNSWLGFKYGPQVYDGVVLSLCSNDANLFERSYRVKYPELQQTQWVSTHPVGEAVARCFDDIALFVRESSLPAAVCFFRVDNLTDRQRIGEIIGDLCAARGLPYIDVFALYRDRHFKREDLVVSSADSHPSGRAYEAVGRQLAATMKRFGWFCESDASTIGAAPDRILASVRAMVETDHYPPDAALNWALGALDAKSLVARRMPALESSDDFSAASARAADVLTTASRRWHTVERARASVQEIATGGAGIAWCLFRVQEERLKLEELTFALGTGDWNRLAACLPEGEPTQQIAPEAWPADAASLLEGCSLDILRLRDVLDGLRIPPVAAAFGSLYDEASVLADLDALARLADRAEIECIGLKALFLRWERVFGDALPSLTAADIAHISRLMGAALTNMKESFAFVQRLHAAMKRIRDADNAPFTTVEVSISAKPIEGRPLCYLGGSAEYSVPNRLPFNDAGSFWPDGSTTLIKLRFPTFYAGRFSLRAFNSKAPNWQAVDITIVKAELYNGKNQRRNVEPSCFYRNRNDRLVSPFVYLP